MKTNDYTYFDKLTLFVKNEKTQNIIEYYKFLGWEVESQQSNNRYVDLTDLVFRRPHKIENKDELQLLQIYLEDRLNAQGKIEKNKHSKTKAFGLSFGILGLIFLIVGILTLVNVIILDIGFGIAFCSLAFVLFLSGSLIIPKLFKRENFIFKLQQAKINTDIKNICDRVYLLTGGKDE